MTWLAQVLPGGRLLASADETGNVAVADLRMLGSARQPLLWQVHSLSVFARTAQAHLLTSASVALIWALVFPWHLVSWMPHSVAAAGENV